jgi:hypothetical protein
MVPASEKAIVELLGMLRCLLHGGEASLTAEFDEDLAKWHEVSAMLSWARTDRAERAGTLQTTSQHMLQMTAELFDVLDVLARAGTEAIPFKGPALVWELYTSPALRPCCDLDILIRREQATVAIAALETAGYVSEYRVDARLYEAYRHYAMERDGCIVELHWGLMPGGHAYGGDVAGVFARSREVMVAGRAIRTLAIEDLLPYLCLHAAKHRWDKAKWAVDIDRLLALHGASLDWARLWGETRRAGCRRALAVGLELARERLGAALPQGADMGIDNATRRLAAKVNWRRPATRLECIHYQIECADWWRKLPVALSFLRPTPLDGAEDGGYWKAVRARAARAWRNAVGQAR